MKKEKRLINALQEAYEQELKEKIVQSKSLFKEAIKLAEEQNLKNDIKYLFLDSEIEAVLDPDRCWSESRRCW